MFGLRIREREWSQQPQSNFSPPGSCYFPHPCDKNTQQEATYGRVCSDCSLKGSMMAAVAGSSCSQGIYSLKAEAGNGKQNQARKLQDMPTPTATHFLPRGSASYRIQPSPTAPPAGYQVSEHVSLWGTVDIQTRPVLPFRKDKGGAKGCLGEEGQNKRQGFICMNSTLYPGHTPYT